MFGRSESRRESASASWMRWHSKLQNEVDMQKSKPRLLSHLSESDRCETNPCFGPWVHGRRANFKYHLSLSDSDRLRLLLKISRLAFLAALGRLQAIVGGGGGG